jgi:hypothetical protein
MWYEKCGYWGWTDVETTIQQFLGHPNLLIQKEGLDGKGVGRVITSKIHHYHQMLITYDVFMSMHFDLLIASVPQHVPVFQKLSDNHPSRPKVAFQMGNMWTNYPRNVKNILNATSIIIDPTIHHINYYPEFELDLCRRNIPPVDNRISSFLHINRAHYRDMFMEVEKETGWEFKEYGADNRDGSIPDRCDAVTEKMLQSKFIWQVKRGGEGYGFVIHEAFATGRPPIVNYSDTYCNQRAGELMRPGINCIDVYGKTPTQIAKELVIASDTWGSMSEEARRAFDVRVNFEYQGDQMKKFLEDIL